MYIDINGAMVAVHFEDLDHPPRVVAEYVPDSKGFALPINCIFVNGGDGRSAKLLIESISQQHLGWLT